MRSLTVASLLAALLLLPTALALPLEARVEDATLVIEVAEGTPTNAHVVVSHQDERHWVDRVVKVERPGPNATIRLDGLPRETPLTVRVLDASTPLPRRADAPAFYDAGAIAAMPAHATVVARAIPFDAGGRVVPSHHVDIPSFAGRDIFVAPDGRVALLHALPNGGLAVRTSTDGGRSVSGSLTLMAASGSEPTYFAGLTTGGHLVVIWRMTRYVDDPNDYEPGYTSYDPWRYQRVDLASMTIVVDRTFTVGGSDFESYAGDLVAGPGHTMTLYFTGPLQTLDAQGRNTRTTSSDRVNIAQVSAEGVGALVGEVPRAGYSQNLRAAVGPTGKVALAGVANLGMPNASTRAWIATSTTGPGGIGAPQNVTLSLVPAQDHQVFVHSIAVDALDNVHISFVSGRNGQPMMVFTSYYLRQAADGSITSLDLRAASPTGVASDHSMSTGLVAASGRTVWLTWSSNHNGDKTWLQRSTDGGATWQQPILLRMATAPFHTYASGSRPLVALPDGRPVLQAGHGGLLLPFDPDAPAGSRLTLVSVAQPPSPPPPPREGVDIISVEPTNLHVPRDGAHMTVTLRNPGTRTVVVDLVLAGTTARFSLEPSTIAIPAGGSITVSSLVRLHESTPRGGSGNGGLIANPDHGDLGRSDPLFISWDGADKPSILTPQPPPLPSVEVPSVPTWLDTMPRSPSPAVETPPVFVPGPPMGLIVLAVALGAIGAARRRE